MMGKVALSSGLQTNFFEVVQPLFNGSILQEPEKLNRVSHPFNERETSPASKLRTALPSSRSIMGILSPQAVPH